MEGGSENSFGIHVARMAGMPHTIVARAAEILQDLEKNRLSSESPKQALKQVAASAPIQLSLFETVDPTAGKLKHMISALDIYTMTPIDCMMKLNELKKVIEGG